MRSNQSYRSVVPILLLLIAPAAARAADILQEVPNDALGFAVARHLDKVDAKAKWLSLEMRNIGFSPLAFLKTATNVQDGVNFEGDFLLAVYPDPHGDKSHLRFGVWLPVNDYARFSKSIGATSADGVSVVTVAGEDLLVARHGEWALIMDPDQRDRMTQLLAAAPSPPPQIAAWKPWITANDVTVVAFASGVREVLSRANDADGDGKPDNESSDDAFGAKNPTFRRRQIIVTGVNRPYPTGGLAGLLNEFHKWTAASPAISRAVEQANMVGCGFRINPDGSNSGSALASLRIAFGDELEAEPNDAKAGAPYSIYDNGGFAIAAAGRLPKPVLATLASAYVQTIAADMKKEDRTELDEDSLQQLNEAAEQAAGEIRSAVVLTQPGAQIQPVYTNNFVVLRVSSAKEFVDHAAEVMRLWNKANRDADGENKLIFELEETKLGDRTAKQYSLDFASMVGGQGQPPLPEVRQAMEKLFGPGGKLRLWVVPTDDNTVLLAQATQDQVTAALKVIDRKQPIDWNRSESSVPNHLLPAESDWRVFFDPHRYYDWERREAMAVTGVRVIGGPLVRPFRDSPPIGIAGGFHDQELWIEAAALMPTLKSAYEFMAGTNARMRPEVQLRIQRVPR